MKQNILRIAFFFLFVSCFLFQVSSVRAEVIHNFQSEIKILNSGAIDIIEYIEYDFENLQRHGIYRNIPYIKTNKGGKKFKLEIDVNEVVDEKGNEYKSRTTVDRSKNEVSIKIGDPNRYVTGIKKYFISYRVYGALTYFSDHDELYWNITGSNWIVPIEKSLAKIVLPTVLDEENIRKACYTGAQGSTASDCDIGVQSDGTYYESFRPLNPGEGFTTVFGFPKGIVAVLEPQPYVPFNETWYGKFTLFILAVVVGLLLLFWYVCYPLWIIYKWFKYGRDPKVSLGVTRASFDPPKLPGGRPLTPGEAGALVDEVVNPHDILATLVDLARRGFLTIEEKKKKDFYLHKKKGNDGTLLPFEKHFFDGIFSSGDDVRLKDQHLFATVSETKNLLYNSMVTDGLFPKNPDTIRGFYIAIAVIALMTINFPLALIAFAFGWVMPRKTKLGAELANRAKSLKNFLVSQERQLAFQAKEKHMFEKLLPFAVAFGVEKIWAERFKDIHLKPPDWYSTYNSGSFNSVRFTNSLNSSFGSFSSAATPTSSSSGFSSGFSGGSSGGGGGGGGGGSW